MDILLIPGLWLDASSWNDVLPTLQDAGHRPVPLTMPGLGLPAPESADIGITDWVDAVTSEIDRHADPVVLVAHSGGGNVAWGAVDARPDRVARVVLVDTVLPADGGSISEFPLVDGVVPFPDWESFDAPDTADLDPPTRARIAAMTASVPGRVPTDPLPLTDERRHRVPVTILSGALDDAQLRAMLSEWPRYAAELDAVVEVDVIPLGSGHWPQYSMPTRLAEAILTAVDGGA